VLTIYNKSKMQIKKPSIIEGFFMSATQEFNYTRLVTKLKIRFKINSSLGTAQRELTYKNIMNYSV